MTDDAALVDRVLGAGEGPIVVVGDLLLDRFIEGRADRISREAPAPVVRVDRTTDVPGGAANTAANLAALGVPVRLVGAVGGDADGDRLLALLTAGGVDTAAVARPGGLATTVKARISGGGQLVVRIDSGDRVDDEGRDRIAEGLPAALDGARAVLVCDYGMGATEGAVRDALAEARPGVLVVDAHDLAPWAPLAPTAVTPNAGETERLIGPLGDDRAATAASAAAALLAATGAAGVVVTLDRDGTVVLDRSGSSRTFTRPAPDSMANGAGDTFAAALTTALAAGEDLHRAARFAQLAADVVVRRSGTAVCSAAALRASLDEGASLLDPAALVDALAVHRAAGSRIVFTNGIFDMLHLGHTAYLKQARQQGDLLVVAVNDDESVRRAKGPGRPINGAADRAGVLAELACVDYVTVFAGDTPSGLIAEIRPDVYVKGGDYTPEMLPEAPVVLGYGGEVRIVDWVSPHSTSELVARIRSTDQPDPA